MGLWSLLAGILIFLSAAFSQETVVNTTVNPRTLHQGPLEKGWSFQSLPATQKEDPHTGSPTLGDAMLTAVGGATSFTFEGKPSAVFLFRFPYLSKRNTNFRLWFDIGNNENRISS